VLCALSRLPRGGNICSVALLQKTHYALSRDNRLLRADGEQRIRQFVAHEENALENAHYQFNGHSLSFESAFRFRSQRKHWPAKPGSANFASFVRNKYYRCGKTASDRVSDLTRCLGCLYQGLEFPVLKII
jgi:hypothetical protein